MARKQATATVRGSMPKYLGTVDEEALAPAERIARVILTERRDLSPSVAMIMDAGLDESVALRAIELFRDSLHTVGDPHRDPSVAIDRARGKWTSA